MEYTAIELNGSGSLNKSILQSGTLYTFRLFRVPNQTGGDINRPLSGSGYFVFETKKNSHGFYSGSETPNFVEFMDISPGIFNPPSTASFGVKGLVTSSYMFGYDLFKTTSSNEESPYNQFSATSSFQVLPSLTVPLSMAYFRATGMYEMEVQPNSQACGTEFRNEGGSNYPRLLQPIFTADTGTVTVTLTGPGVPTWVKVEWNSVVQVNTGFALTNATNVNNYNNLASTQRSNFQTYLTGKAVVGGSGNYPAPAGGSGVDEILSDGFPKVQLFTSTTFNKNAASPAFADVEVYNALGGTSGWQVTVSCPA